MWKLASTSPCAFSDAQLGFLRQQLLRDDRDAAPLPAVVRHEHCVGPGAREPREEHADVDPLSKQVEQEVEAGIDERSDAAHELNPDQGLVGQVEKAVETGMEDAPVVHNLQAD
eukprot:TRINITY_DN7009_c0_g1_i13.p2 TRINITY_DN7009_c0_g1~~TRINITY_DN7009_c0_g1_i13.p2  ORF type:complete len:114 (-),score=30.61 TRINITY_DN7009_c0_g1_i13:302-643(-)